MLKHQERYEERAKASVCDHWGLALVAGLTGAFVGESQADVIKISKDFPCDSTDLDDPFAN